MILEFRPKGNRRGPTMVLHVDSIKPYGGKLHIHLSHQQNDVNRIRASGLICFEVKSEGIHANRVTMSPRTFNEQLLEIRK